MRRQPVNTRAIRTQRGSGAESRSTSSLQCPLIPQPTAKAVDAWITVQTHQVGSIRLPVAPNCPLLPRCRGTAPAECGTAHGGKTRHHAVRFWCDDRQCGTHKGPIFCTWAAAQTSAGPPKTASPSGTRTHTCNNRHRGTANPAQQASFSSDPSAGFRLNSPAGRNIR